MKLFKRIYWLIAVAALIGVILFAPHVVDYEWGVGAYIAITWIVFVIVFGLVGVFAPQIQKRFLDK